MYYSVHQIGMDQFIEQKSEFIGIAKPVETEEEALQVVEEIRKSHPKATHHCYAYVLGEQQNIQRFQDDGEPSGTAGIPMLEVLKKRNLTNVLVVAVRYFGGILLGAGGLARAYTKSAVIGLEKARVVEKKISKVVILTVDYEKIGMVDYALRREVWLELDRKYGEKVEVKLQILQDKYEIFIQSMEKIFSGSMKINIEEETTVSVEKGKIIQ